MNSVQGKEAIAALGGILPVRIPQREMLDALSDDTFSSVSLQVDDLKRDGRFFLLGDYGFDDLDVDQDIADLFRDGALAGPYDRWAFLICYLPKKGEDAEPLNLLVMVTHKGDTCSFEVWRSCRFGNGSIIGALLCDGELKPNSDSGELDFPYTSHSSAVDGGNVHVFASLVLSAMFRIADSRVPVERITPDVKLNAARAKRGKPPIPSYWRVGDPYVTTLSPDRAATPIRTGTGTHASPTPHSRRGHPRRLPSGRIVWVRDCAVNETVKNLTRQRAFYALTDAGHKAAERGQ